VGSSAITLGAGTVTVTQPGAPNIIVEPSQVIVGTETVAIPQGFPATTTLTVGGAIVTLSPPSPISTSAMSTFPFPPDTSLTEVVINGKTFTLPLSGELTLQQGDGTNIVLGPSSVLVGSQHFIIPPVSAATDISADGGGSSIKAMPAAKKSSDRKKGCSGLGCLLKAFGGLVKGATDLASDVTNVAEKGSSWVAGQVTDTGLASTLSGFIGSATSGKL
jgi:hypothetical protein